MHFHCGYNMPGYLPEMDPYIVGSKRAAIAAVKEEVKRLNDMECGRDAHQYKHGPYIKRGNKGDYYLEPRGCYGGATLHVWYQACSDTECENEDGS